MTIVFVGLTLIALYILLNLLYKRTNHYKNSRIMHRAIERGVPGHIVFANFGSTYSQYAFNSYESLGLNKAYNFALPCESSEADLAKLSRFADHLEKGCVVAITLAPCNTLYHWGQLNEGVKHYGYLSKKVKKDWRLVNYIRYYLPLFPLNIKKVVRILRDVRCYDDITDLTPSKVYTGTEVQERAEEMVKTWVDMFGLEDLKHPIKKEYNLEMVSLNKEVISNFIDKCHECSFRPVLVTTPFIGELNSYFSDSFLNSTLGPIFTVAREKNVPIYDMREAEDFQNNSGLFSDGYFCLNKYGSEKFVKALFSMMKEDGIELNNSSLRL